MDPLVDLLKAMPSKTAITAAEARRLVGKWEIIWLPKVSYIDSETLAVLSAHDRGRLDLAGLANLSLESAEILCRCRAMLFLGLKTLTADVAEALAQHCGTLGLNDLTELPVDVAEALAQHRGTLALSGLTELPVDVAEALAQHRGTLVLNGLTELPVDVAKALAQHRGPLSLHGLTALSAGLAAALAELAGDLHLTGLKALSAEAAEALAGHSHPLWLDGLNELPVDIAEALAQHQGSLSLHGLTALSAELAAALAELAGDLHLTGLKAFSAEAAEALAGHSHTLWLDGLNELPVDVAEALAQHQGELSLSGIQAISAATAEALSSHTDRLWLSALGAIDTATCEALAQHQGDLFLEGVKSLTAEEADALAKHAGHGLVLDGLTNPSASVLESLAEHDGWLSLDGLATLSQQNARILVRTKGHLYLNGVYRLTSSAANILGTHGHDVYLNGIRVITPSAAEGLAACRGELFLNGLASIDASTAAALANHTSSLHLDGLKTISSNVAQHLASHKGSRLTLNGLASISSAAKELLFTYEGTLEARGIGHTEDDELWRIVALPLPVAVPDCPSDAVGDSSNEELLIRARADLDALVGLATVKKEVNGLITFLRAQKLRASVGLKAEEISRHLAFSGNPGTGKTTVARIVGSIYKAAGFLSKGHTVESDRSALVAEWIGQTAPKTLEACKKALGGVLFIDEAYSLAPPDHFGNDFGKEAIDTLLKFMEDNREDLVVIVAGYPEKMEAFLNSNPGMQSRFNKTVVFENYGPEELLDILRGMCLKGDYVLSAGAEQAALRMFSQECRNADEKFGNARYARNIYQQALLEHGRRIGDLANPTKEELQTLEAEDFSA
jgi:stage V sporulation protein K